MDEPKKGMDDPLLFILGEIKGELTGIRSQISDSNIATNKRIDDLSSSVREQTKSLNQRINDHQQDTENRFLHVERRIDGVEKNISNGNKKMIVSSGSASALAIALSEVIKAFIK